MTIRQRLERVALERSTALRRVLREAQHLQQRIVRAVARIQHDQAMGPSIHL